MSIPRLMRSTSSLRPRRSAPKTRAALIAMVWLSSTTATVARAEDHTAGPTDYRSILPGLAPGDRLRLSPGRYDGLPVVGLHGTDDERILIEGPQDGERAVIVGNPARNTITVQDASYVTIRNLEVDQEGHYVDGLKVPSGTSAHHITVENIHFHSFIAEQQVVGISTKSPVWDWVIRGNVIEDAGTGLYLGNSDGSEPFVRGIVEHNLVVNPIGYAMQIKHQNPRPTLGGLPTTDSITVIRHNVFMKYAGASTGADARPNLLVGHFPPSGPGRDDRYEIYGNFLYENASGTEALFQGEGNVAFYDNVLVSSYGDGVRIQPHNDVPKSIDVFNNTVVAAGAGIHIVGADASYVQRVFGNAVFAASPLSGGRQSANVVGSPADAATYLRAPAAPLGTLDLSPLDDTLAVSDLDLSAVSERTDFDRDFDGLARPVTTAGAYAPSAAGPAWPLGEAVKRLAPPANPGPDAGVPDAGSAPAMDAGVTDAGRADDAGRPSLGEPVSGGCAHTRTGGRSSTIAAPILVAALLGLRRRRRFR